ncbi:Xaa-Pro aminopeptidase [Litoreibacter ascidiaceicola]|uniref:Xaa-Pro aminopeptidase n=1 Tax=Litoreibacter ascidiaceicola TaxID=1486859 RepID=A0A1M5EH98_9RHOB|nr:aminopeptidase P family protein [Litoreibacter ascidiaceicola]SHF78567.1 Xaa-Pro aminopeptidase [Litoreibacter ascidiaceicola]
MFQRFDDSTSPDQGPPRLKALRQQLEIESFDGFLIPRADAYQGEYVAPSDDRLAWLTGFTGSAGFCVVLRDIAGVFIDGRYRLQVKSQVDTTHFTPVAWPETKPGPWLKEHLPAPHVMAYDPWLHTLSEIESIEAAGVTLVTTDNLVDRVWADRPAPPVGKITVQPLELAGESHEDKRARLAAQLRDAGHDAAILTLPDSIAWLLNIRGSDIPRNPVPHCLAILHADASLDLFAASEKLTETGDHLGCDIRLHAPEDFLEALAALNGTVRVDKAYAPAIVPQTITAQIAFDDDPCILPKACKNATEIEGARSAHLRDAHAMVNFLAWLDEQQPGLTEIDVVTALEGFRAETNALRDISFETIAGAGPNGAIVHYRCTKNTNRALQDGELLLVDSGGQYVDGTTDITRTVVMGSPAREQQECYTLVLQGMIALSMARFPRGLAGRDIDALARAPLWRHGLDYDHGTGHGVGSYLSVHEGPARISRLSDVALQPGMILSNEPGYYREGAFGIRIENLIVVQDAPQMGDKRDQLSFETLTWVPLDRRLIAVDMLSPSERDWIDRYHATIAEKLSVQGKARDWLEAATQPL